MLGLRFCARAFSSCGKRGPLFIAVRGPLTIAASLVAEHRLQTCRLSSCGSRAQLLRGMWDLPRPGLEPMSPALAGRFSTTAPPGKPERLICNKKSGDRHTKVGSVDQCCPQGPRRSWSFFSAVCNVSVMFPLVFKRWLPPYQTSRLSNSIQIRKQGRQRQMGFLFMCLSYQREKSFSQASG